MLWLIYGFSHPVAHTVEVSVAASKNQLGFHYKKNETIGTVASIGQVVQQPASNNNSKDKNGTASYPTGANFDEGCEELRNVKLFKTSRQITYHHPHIAASCSLLTEGNKYELGKVNAQRKKWKSNVSDGEFLEGLHNNCDRVRQEFNHLSYSSSQERSFPIAFEMLIYYKEGRIQQYIRLLKFLYRPHNAYCIHIDKKSPQWWKDHIHSFSSCFHNILIADDPVEIKYATATILDAHLRCLKTLLHSGIYWHYVITLHATELPLVTNREMVEHLKLLNGVNFINKGLVANSANSQVRDWMTYKVKSVNKGTWVVLSKERLDKPPHNIRVYKSGSSANSALSRGFVKFLFDNHKVQDLLRWLKDVHSAVEFFFSTVNQMPEAPGHSDDINELAHREWSHDIAKDHRLCRESKIVHDICIVSSADLPRLTKLSKDKVYWFFNKYFIGYDHVLMDCMEKLLVQRNIKEYEKDCES